MKINNFDKFREKIKLKNIKFRSIFRTKRIINRIPRNEEDRITLFLIDKMRWGKNIRNKELIIKNHSQYKFNSL